MRRFITATFVVASSASLAAAQFTGFSVSDANKHMYRINLTTGLATDLGEIPYVDTGMTDDPTNGEIEGLTTIGSNIYGVDEANNSDGLLWRNLSVPPGATVGMTGNRFGTEAGLSYNRLNGLLYNINSEDRNTPGFTRGTQLYSIVPATGVATAIGSMQPQFVDGLAINASGAAFATDFRLSSNLYSVNLTNGALTSVGPLGVSEIGDSGAEFAPNGVLYALEEDGNIYTINTSTGAATFVASVVNAAGARIPGDFEGLAIVPEPTTLCLVVAAAVLLGLRSRRY